MKTIEDFTIPSLPFCPAPIELIETYGPNGVEGASIARLPFSGRCKIFRDGFGGWAYETCNGSPHGKRVQGRGTYQNTLLAAWKWACRRVREEQKKNT